MNFPADYITLDAVELGARIRAGELHPTEAVTAALTQIERYEPEINAVTWRCYDLALRAAGRPLPDSPLAGVPFLVKDLSLTLAGAPFEMGCRMRRGLAADHDAALTARYKAAGLLILGQTAAPEFGASVDTVSELNGATFNPWDLERSPGGSSGGAAAAAAARYTPAAHASDGAGSIRIPASMCGLFGLKPTRGRTPKGPDAAEGWFGMSVEHAVTRTVRDSAALLDLSHGPDPGAPYYPPPPERPYLEEVGSPPGRLNIAFSTGSMLAEGMHPACVRAVEQAAGLLEELGHRVAPARPSINADRFKESMLVMMAADAAYAIDHSARAAGRRPSEHLFEASSWLTGRIGGRLTAVELAEAVKYLRNIGRRTAPFFEEYDVFVEPTIARPPWKSGELSPELSNLAKLHLRSAALRPGNKALLRAVGGIGDRVLEAVPNTALWNATGQPSMTAPLHWSEGLPIGVQFTARYADEALLFRLAAQLEEARPWADRLPPLLTRSRV